MHRTRNYVDYSFDHQGQQMLARKRSRDARERKGVGYSLEMQRIMVINRAKRETEKVVVTLPRVRWLERPEVT